MEGGGIKTVDFSYALQNFILLGKLKIRVGFLVIKFFDIIVRRIDFVNHISRRGFK
jgi:hypothetical protein